MLESLANSGCKKIALDIGFNNEEFRRLVKRIHSYGMETLGYYVFGFESHDETTFEQFVKFVEGTGMKDFYLAILVPYPNTPLYQQFEKEGRILTRDWSLYDQGHVVFKPRLMFPEALENGFKWVLEQTNNFF